MDAPLCPGRNNQSKSMFISQFNATYHLTNKGQKSLQFAVFSYTGASTTREFFYHTPGIRGYMPTEGSNIMGTEPKIGYVGQLSKKVSKS